MKKISLREFNRNPGKYTKDFPLVLTRYNRDFCKVYAVKDVVEEEATDEIRTIPLPEVTKEDIVIADVHKMPPMILERCKVPNCFNAAVGEWNVYGGDGFGEAKMKLCKKHLQTAKRENPEGMPV